MVDALEHGVAVEPSLKLGTEVEGAGHLAMEGVHLLWWGHQPVLQEHGNQTLDPAGRVLRAEVKRFVCGKRFPQDHDGIHVSCYQLLGGGVGRGGEGRGRGGRGGEGKEGRGGRRGGEGRVWSHAELAAVFIYTYTYPFLKPNMGAASQGNYRQRSMKASPLHCYIHHQETARDTKSMHNTRTHTHTHTHTPWHVPYTILHACNLHDFLR